MKIGMIGAGNLASHLAPALQNAGHEIVAVYSRTRLSAEGLAGKMGVPAIVNLEQMPKADVYVFPYVMMFCRRWLTIGVLSIRKHFFAHGRKCAFVRF